MKIFLKILALLLATLVFIILGIGIWLKTDSTQSLIQKKISHYFEENMDLAIDIKQIHLSFPFKLSTDAIIVSDKDGVVGEIKSLKVDIFLSPLFFKRITLSSITADQINLLKKPRIKTQTDKIKENDNAVSNRWFNPDFIIKEINIAVVNMHPEFIGAKDIISFNIKSNLSYIAQDQLLNYQLSSKLLLPKQNSDTAMLNLLGSYNIYNKQLSVQTIELTSDYANVTGDLQIDQKKDIVNGNIAYQSDILSKLLEQRWPEIKADTKGKLTINGNIKQPVINISGNILLDNHADDLVEFFPLIYDAEFTTDTQFNVTGHVNLQYDSLKTHGILEYSKNQLFLKDFETLGDDFKNTIDLTVDLNTLLLNGFVNIQDDTLAETSKYLPVLYSGMIDMKAKFSSSDNKKQQISLTGNAKNISGTFGSLDFLSFDLNSDNLASKELNSPNILVHTLNIDGFIINEIKLNAQSKNNIIALKTNIISKESYPFDIEISNNIHFMDDGGIKVDIKQLAGTAGGAKISNSGNFNLYYGDLLKFDIDKIQIDSGSLSLTGEVNESKVSAQGIINHISAKIFDDLLSEKFKNSIINGKIDLNGTLHEPILTSNINITDILSLDENKKFNLVLDSKTNHNQTDIAINASLMTKKIASINGTVKNNFSLWPLKFDLNADQNFIINADFIEQFDILSLLPEFPGQKIEGVLNGNIKVTGTPATPIIKGNLKLINGKYVYKNLGIKFKNITSNIQADGYKVNFSQIKAQDNFNNEMHGSGNVNLKNFNYYFKAETSKLNPISTPYINGDISGQLAIEGDTHGAMATGHFALGPLEIKIPERFKQNIPELNVVETENIDPNEQAKDKKQIYDLRLKVNLVTNDKVFVRGWGVDTRLDGTLKVSGSLNNPNVKGSLHAVKGRYQEFGKVLNIKEGVLTFDGGPIIPSPYLNIVGETEAGGNEIRVILAGSIASPEIRLESTPDMSEERALSMLLFGTDTQNIQPFQALQLADSARRLSGHGGNFDPLGMGRKILKVDDINFKTDAADPEKSSIGVGKYLTEKVYFEVEQGQQENTTKTRVEVQLTPKISIENVIEQRGNTSFGINWRFDY